jgi:hypothetical protein
VALYGDLDTVDQMLRSSPGVVLGSDVTEALEPIQRTVSLIIEEKTGRSFGGVAAPSTRTIMGGNNTVLLLDPPARTITSISTLGTLAGTVVSGSIVLLTDYWTPELVDEDGLIWGIRLLYGNRWGWADRYGNPATPVEVTGTWADDPDGAGIPAEIDHIANYLTAAIYRRQRTFGAAQIGPDGAVTTVADPWKDQTVIQTLEAFSLNKMVALR